MNGCAHYTLAARKCFVACKASARFPPARSDLPCSGAFHGLSTAPLHRVHRSSRLFVIPRPHSLTYALCSIRTASLPSNGIPFAMASTGIIQVANETFASSSRITKEGRKITYRMKVIQQPERARACGSGAKSSADRRPVDPPPIVELRIFEGPGAENEITFNYNANFFLFATLDNARHIAQGRVPQPSQPSFPVLTGTPVAGMAYLDRPAPAGYFIFPDLSVRHEGRYRLSFSLYEELKEQKDMDTETQDSTDIQKSAHVSHRLEVKSQVFTVFSAKKFPGLTESTALSRMVAEQGCRVRIRRDVRMRRRENKANRDYDYDDEDGRYDRARASATPDSYHHPAGDGIDRPRSGSNASKSSYITQRRPSMEQLNTGYQQPYAPAPLTPSASQGMYPPSQPMQQWQQQPPPPQQPVNYMQPPAPPYTSQPSYPPQPAPVMPQQYGFAPPQYPQAHHGRNNSMEIPAPPTGPAYPTSAPQAPMPQYPSTSHPMSPYASNFSKPLTQAPALQPIQTTHPGMQGMQQQSVASPSHYSSAPVHSPLAKPDHRAQPPYPMPQVQSPEHQPEPQYHDYGASQIAPPNFPPHPSTKRSYGSTFDNTYHDERLQQGARPGSSVTSPKGSYAPDALDDEQASFDEPAMSYRRADGTERRRRVPLVA